MVTAMVERACRAAALSDTAGASEPAAYLLDMEQAKAETGTEAPDQATVEVEAGTGSAREPEPQAAAAIAEPEVAPAELEETISDAEVAAARALAADAAQELAAAEPAVAETATATTKPEATLQEQEQEDEAQAEMAGQKGEPLTAARSIGSDSPNEAESAIGEPEAVHVAVPAGLTDDAMEAGDSAQLSAGALILEETVAAAIDVEESADEAAVEERHQLADKGERLKAMVGTEEGEEEYVTAAAAFGGLDLSDSLVVRKSDLELAREAALAADAPRRSARGTMAAEYEGPRRGQGCSYQRLHHKLISLPSCLPHTTLTGTSLHAIPCHSTISRCPIILSVQPQGQPGAAQKRAGAGQGGSKGSACTAPVGTCSTGLPCVSAGGR